MLVDGVGVVWWACHGTYACWKIRFVLTSADQVSRTNNVSWALEYPATATTSIAIDISEGTSVQLQRWASGLELIVQI